MLCYLFFFYVVENGANGGPRQGCKIRRDVEISKLNMFFSLFFSIVKSFDVLLLDINGF